MIRVGRSDAERSGVANIAWRDCAVEDLELRSRSFELVTAGNAFQRLPRQIVAAKVLEWLRPGGCFALLWGGTPWQEGRAWQQAMSATFERWMDVVRSRGRVRAEWQKVRAALPDLGSYETRASRSSGGSAPK